LKTVAFKEFSKEEIRRREGKAERSGLHRGDIQLLGVLGVGVFYSGLAIGHEGAKCMTA